MDKVLIFAGTTEGRLLAERAAQLGVWCMASTATEYGACLLDRLDGIHIRSGRLDPQGMKELIFREGITHVIDATHPFAVEATRQIRQACVETGTKYVRCLREPTDSETVHTNQVGAAGAERICGSDRALREGQTDGVCESAGAEQPQIVLVETVPEAVEYLKTTEGKILIATGSKELSCYTQIGDYKERCFARVLSTRAAVEESASLGFEGRHLIAMQGPFSEEMNLALLHQTGAAYFVTKESGKAGGYEEKVSAARRAGAVLVVVGRPYEEGKSLEDVKRLLAELDVM